MTENRRIFWNVVATYGRSLYGLVLGLLCGRWALLALGEVNYGLNGLVGGLALFVAFFNNVLAESNARFYTYSVGAAKVSTDKCMALDECIRWFNTAVSIHTIIPLALIIIGYPIGAHAITYWLTIPVDRIPSCLWVFRFVCISCLFGMMSVPFSAMYTAKQYIAELTIYSFATSTLNVLVLYYMVNHPADWLVYYAGWTCFLAVVPQAIICIRASIIFPECQIRSTYMFEKSRLRQLGTFSVWQGLEAFCSLLRLQGVPIVINKFFGAEMNAAQTIGNTIQGQCSTLGAAVQGAFLPVITQSCGEGNLDKMNSLVIRSCKLTILSIIVFMIPLALELPEVMRLWLKQPPAHSVGLCYCAMLYALAMFSTSAHMTAINAVGRIVTCYKVLCSVNICTIPLAIVVGLVCRNVYYVMGTVILMVFINAAGRVFFARYLAGTSVRLWIREVLIPLIVLIFVCGMLGVTTRMILRESFIRVLCTAILTTIAFVPLTWFLFLSKEEHMFVRNKLMYLKGLVLRNRM